MKFTLEINMGNETMSSQYDVAEAVRKVSHHLTTRPGEDIGSIMDLNGNKVGEWAFRGSMT